MEEENIAPKHLCCSCQKILRSPIQTLCGHRFCTDCFESIVLRESHSYCPACNEEEDGNQSILHREETFSDKAILRELQAISLSCQNAGCDWSGTYTDYDKEHADYCPFAFIICVNTGCEVRMTRQELVNHLTNVCDMREVQCQYCAVKMPCVDLQIHLVESCEGAPVSCRYCSEKMNSRAQLKVHLDVKTGDCQKRLVPCKYETFGCKELVEYCNAEKHCDLHQAEHLDLLRENVAQQTNIIDEVRSQNRLEELTKVIAEHQKTINDLKAMSQNLQAEIDNTKAEMETNRKLSLSKSITNSRDENETIVKTLSGRLKVIETKLSTLEEIVGVLNNQLKQNIGRIKSLEKQRQEDKTMAESLQNKIRAQDKILSLKDVTMEENNLRIQSLELASHNGLSVWKINNFKEKRANAISGKTLSLYSPCFFSSRHGYKMCARIYLNGDGMGKGNHASLFFTIMKGPYDALLRWPFRQKVTFMWVDQNNREHIVDAFRPDPTSSSFKRPTQEMNISSGCPLFMPLTMLDSPRHAFVKDDVAFLKIIVDTSDIA